MHARGFTFSLKPWLRLRTSWASVESLSPCNKALGKLPPFLFANRRHIPTLIFFSTTTLFSIFSPLPWRSIDFVPSHEFSPNLSPERLPRPPHKKYNIFLSFDPTTSPFLSYPCLFVSLCAWRICKFNSTRKSRRVCATTARSGRLDCFVLWDSNMNYKPAPWLLHSCSLLIRTRTVISSYFSANCAFA